MQKAKKKSQEFMGDLFIQAVQSRFQKTAPPNVSTRLTIDGYLTVFTLSSKQLAESEHFKRQPLVF